MSNPEDALISSVLAELLTAYRERQADRYLACFAESAFVYGTGVDEKCQGSSEIRAHLERDWTQSLSASFTLIDPQITASDSFAWVASDCRFEFRTTEGDGSMPGRVSFVLQRTDGSWKICHAHFSSPTPTEVGQSF
jgi:ketosteroid isomerase-like protein